MLQLRRFKSFIFRVVLFLSDHRWILLSIVMASVGIATVWYEVPFAANLVFAAIAVVMLILELRGYFRVRGEINFLMRRLDRFSDVEEDLANNSRFDFWRLPDVGTFVVDNAMTTAVASGNVSATLATERYRIEPQLAELGGVLRRRRSTGVDFYNGSVLGFKTNLGTDEVTLDEVTLVPATYNDHLATDIFAMHDVYVARQFRSEFGRKLFVDRKGRLRDFHASWLLNCVGTSTIALTTDGRVIAVNQSTKNELDGGLLAPSGSGSLEPSDFHGLSENRLSEVFAAGGLRELAEETGILATDIAEYSFLGFGRWLDKAAKPEAFTLALLSIDSHTALSRAIPKTDKPFSLSKEALRIDVDVEGWLPQASELVIENEDARRRLTLPLFVSLAMLTGAARDPGHMLHERIRAYVK